MPAGARRRSGQLSSLARQHNSSLVAAPASFKRLLRCCVIRHELHEPQEGFKTLSDELLLALHSINQQVDSDFSHYPPTRGIQYLLDVSIKLRDSLRCSVEQPVAFISTISDEFREFCHLGRR